MNQNNFLSYRIILTPPKLNKAITVKSTTHFKIVFKYITHKMGISLYSKEWNLSLNDKKSLEIYKTSYHKIRDVRDFVSYFNSHFKRSHFFTVFAAQYLVFDLNTRLCNNIFDQVHYTKNRFYLWLPIQMHRSSFFPKAFLICAFPLHEKSSEMKIIYLNSSYNSPDQLILPLTKYLN